MSTPIREFVEQFIEAERVATNATSMPDLTAQHAAVDRLRTFVAPECRRHGFVGAQLGPGEELEVPFEAKLENLSSPEYYDMVKGKESQGRKLLRVDTFEDDDARIRYRCILSFGHSGKKYRHALVVNEVGGSLKITALAYFVPPRYKDDPIDEDNRPKWKYDAGNPDVYRDSKSEFNFDSLGKKVTTELLAAPTEEYSLLYHEGDVVGF